MPISFANIPANIKVPLYWVEVDPSMAGLPQHQSARAAGRHHDRRRRPRRTIFRCRSEARRRPINAFGQGSELSRMFKAFFANNFANEVWGLPVAETVGALAATGMITITTAPTAAGTIHLYIGGDTGAGQRRTTDTVDDDRDRDRGCDQRRTWRCRSPPMRSPAR